MKNKKEEMKMIEKLKEYFKDFRFEYKDSKNKFYFINKYKILFSASFAIFGFVFGVIGFLFEGNHLLSSITNTMALFALNTPDSYAKSNIFLLLSTLFIASAIFSAALFTFFQEFVNRYIAKKIIKNNHIAVFGLGEINRAFLNSDFKDNQVVIIEENSKNTFIDEFRQEGFGVIIGDVLSSKQLELLNYETMDHAIIALGDDRINIELAIKIIEAIKRLGVESPTRLVVHIQNNELKEIFHQEFVLPSTENKLKIDIKTFSFYEECSKDLFDNKNIIPIEYIKTNNEFKSVILGDGKLASSMIKDILLLSNFPNKNKHTISLISKKAKDFYEQIKLQTFYDENKFPSVKFEIIEKDYKKISFYTQKIFLDKDLVNIFVCYDDEEINLNLSLELNNKIFLRNSSLKTQVYFAMFKEYSLSKEINSNDKFFGRFFTFGNQENIFSKDKLIDDDNYKIAKMIHNGYGDEFKKDVLTSLENLNQKWFNSTKFSDKLSNIAQSKHINVKLQALGLKKVKLKGEENDVNKLLESNRKTFDEVMIPLLKEVDLDHEKIKIASLELDKFWSDKEYEVLYMPNKYETLFEKLVEMEHERWNAYHYLNGWDYSQNKDKSLKLHDCLKSLHAFEEKHLQITVLYDIYSILYIPNYLASAGWKICKI